MPKTQMDYSHTIMYKICCKDISNEGLYIGHTTNFIQRKNQHKTTCCNQNLNNYNLNVYQFIRENGGWDNWSMIQIEEYSCNNKREAEMRERYWIENLKANLNCVSPFTTNEEKEKQKLEWYEENKEEVLKKKKKHYQENKDQILEKAKQYTQENKEKITEYQKQYAEENKEKITTQKKEYRAVHKEEAIKAHKKWREDNKEKIKEEKSKIIICDCGSQYTFGNKHRHLKCKTHIDYNNKLCGIINEPEIKMSEEEKLEISRQKQKEYREKNAEKIKEFKKKYNDTHKEQNSIQRKLYYETHKEEIIEQSKKYVEENKEKISEKQKERYQKNKEKILEKIKQTFICQCGSNVRCAGKAEHNKSLKHIDFMKNLSIEQNKLTSSLSLV